jgi:hypothetical protein
MTPTHFILQHLGLAELPSSLPIEIVLEIVGAAKFHGADQASDFDEERIRNLRSALNTIAETTKDHISGLTAKRALINDEQYEGE